MNINQLSKEVASFIKNTNEFKAMNKSKLELDKNFSQYSTGNSASQVRGKNTFVFCEKYSVF